MLQEVDPLMIQLNNKAATDLKEAEAILSSKIHTPPLLASVLLLLHPQLHDPLVSGWNYQRSPAISWIGGNSGTSFLPESTEKLIYLM